MPGPRKSVVGRALTVLSVFEAGEAALSLAELSRRTGLPKPTAIRLLGDLAQWDAVQRVPEGWRLGLRLFEWGHLDPDRSTVVDAAGPFLANLYSATRETVHLVVPDGSEVVYLHKVTGQHSPDVPSRVGGRLPMHCTGVGKAVLAFAPQAVRNEVLGGELARRTPRTLVAPGLIGRDLARVRERGTAEEHEESTLGIACVAAPVLGPDGHAVAAVSVTGWANRLHAGRLAPVVRAAALGIARALHSRL